MLSIPFNVGLQFVVFHVLGMFPYDLNYKFMIYEKLKCNSILGCYSVKIFEPAFLVIIIRMKSVGKLGLF